MFAGTHTGVFLWRCDSRRDPCHIWPSFFSQEFFRSSIRLQTRLRRPSAFQMRVLRNEVTDKLWSQKVHLYSNARACKTAPPPHFWKQFSPTHLSFAASRFTASRSASCVHLQGHSLHFELVSDWSISVVQSEPLLSILQSVSRMQRHAVGANALSYEELQMLSDRFDTRSSVLQLLHPTQII